MDYQDVMIVITDGKDSGDPEYAAGLAEKRGVTTFAIGVGQAPDMRQLLEIANGDRKRVSRFSTFQELAKNVFAVCKPIAGSRRPIVLLARNA